MFEAQAQRSSSTAVIRMHGDLDATADVALQAAYADAVADAPDALVLDFADVDYINSSGIALIVTLLIDARQADRPVAARGLTDHYRHIFEITRLSDYMDIERAATIGRDEPRAARQEAARG